MRAKMKTMCGEEVVCSVHIDQLSLVRCMRAD